MDASLADGIRAGDRRSLARALTWIENRAPQAGPLLEALGHPPALRVGITGPPGAGKSTLVGALIEAWLARDATVGVLAVDPTSPVTGGALLGDRVRMQDHAGNERVFVRSLASRGASGGVSRAVEDAARVLAAAGFSHVCIETVGVGQTEVDVAHVADITVLVLAPGTGDMVQGMKAGLLDLADVVVVNQADRDGATRLETDLQSALALAARQAPPVLRTTATTGEGVSALVAAIEGLAAQARAPAHVMARLRARLRRAVGRALWERFEGRQADAFERELRTLLDDPAGFDDAVLRLVSPETAP